MSKTEKHNPYGFVPRLVALAIAVIGVYLATQESSDRALEISNQLIQDIRGIRIKSVTFNENTNTIMLEVNEKVAGNDATSKILSRTCDVFEDYSYQELPNLNLVITGKNSGKLLHSKLLYRNRCE